MRARITYRDPARPPEEVDLDVPSALLAVERKYPELTREAKDPKVPGVAFVWFYELAYQAYRLTPDGANLAPDALEEWLTDVLRVEEVEEAEDNGAGVRPTVPPPAISPGLES